MAADGSISIARTSRPIRACDLFCGAGGSSTGAQRAARDLGRPLVLTAVNHWDVAIDTHSRNHPGANHHCSDLEHLKPRDAVPEGRLDLLIASPTCTYHSRARGGRPVHDQQRMDPWHVVRWATDLRIDRIMIENVPEFVDWGPCSLTTGRPMPARRGEYFRAWCEALRAVGYRIDWRVLNCADYGDATTRQRFFLIGRADRRALRWPEPTHAKGGSADLLSTRQPWRAAAEIIDWSIPGRSIFGRRKPLAPNTLRRILAGAERYSWPAAHCEALRALLAGSEPNLNASPDDFRALHDSADFVKGVGLVMATGAGGVARDLGQPLPTVTGGGEGGARPHFIQPVILGVNNNGRARDAMSEPLPTITTGGASATAHRGNARPAVVQPLIAPYYGGGSGLTSKPADQPLDAITTKARFGVASPVVVQLSNQSAQQLPRSAADPLPTIAATGHIQLAEPAVTGYRIDILYRMLSWRELARAMSFDDGSEVYDFAGTATDITKQIGNAVPCRTAQAIVRALLEAA